MGALWWNCTSSCRPRCRLSSPTMMHCPSSDASIIKCRQRSSALREEAHSIQAKTVGLCPARLGTYQMWNCDSLCKEAVPIRQGVADPALADPYEEVTRRLGHQQRLGRPAQIINRPLATATQNTNLYMWVSVNDLQYFREWPGMWPGCSKFQSGKRKWVFFFIPPKGSCSQNKCFCCKLVKKNQKHKYIIVQKSAPSSIKV